MKYNKANDVSDRRSAASNAKAALLQGYLAAKDAAEPTRAAKQAERMALAEARETRRTEREQVKRDELARIAEEAAAREAVIIAAARAELKRGNWLKRTVSLAFSRTKQPASSSAIGAMPIARRGKPERSW